MNGSTADDNLERILKSAVAYIHQSTIKRELVVQSSMYSGNFERMREDYLKSELSLLEELTKAEAKQKKLIEKDLASTREKIRQINDLEARQNEINTTPDCIRDPPITLAEAYRKYRPEKRKSDAAGGFFTFMPYPETA